jgi:hypothetical protein
MSITVQSIAGGVGTVQVMTGQRPVDTTPPSAPAPLVAAPAGDRVVLSWPASKDNVGVAGYRVYRDNGLVKTLATATTWTDFVVSPGATYAYRVVASDAAGNATSSPTVSATVPTGSPPPPPDHNPPTTGNPRPPLEVDRGSPWVRISAPGRGARLRRRAVVRARATDAVGVVRTQIWVDGKLRTTVRRPKVAWHWSLRHARRGRHRITVRAFDAAGNVGKASVNVRVTR